MMKTVLVTGGAGYVGSVLVPKLLAAGHQVRVIDLFIYGDTLAASADNPNLQQIKGDIRDEQLVRAALAGVDTIIHLACISNDPSYDLDPRLGKSINYDALKNIIQATKEAGVGRFIQASSSSVYGVKSEPEVTEALLLQPLTDYAMYKALSEELLLRELNPFVPTVIIRSATVCGYSPRQRLDLTVNILTNHAVNNGVITVYGGNQYRPNVHIDDITDLYNHLVTLPTAVIAGKVFNFGAENHQVEAIAKMVQAIVNPPQGIRREATNDNRSYRISSEKIKRELGVYPKRDIADAIHDLTRTFRSGAFSDPMNNDRYYNVKMMKTVRLQ